MFYPDQQSMLLEQLELEATLFGYQERQVDAVCDTRILSDYELIYNIGGKTVVTLEETCYTLTQGQVILIPSHTKHRIDTPATHPHSNFWCHFSMAQSISTQGFLRALLDRWQGHVFHVGVDESLLALYRQILTCSVRQDPFDLALCQLYFKQIVIHLCKKSELDYTFAFSSHNALHDTVIKYVCDHFLEVHTLKDVAQANNISLSYLNNIFNKYFGMSTAKYILHLKFKKAEFLLKNSNQSIGSISETLGFSSPFHFSNAFKQHYAISPSDFRNRKVQY